MIAESRRRLNNKGKLLSFLLARGAATNVELAQIAGLRFGARLMELRREGWLVETEERGRGLVSYRLLRAEPVVSGQGHLFGDAR